MRVRNVAHVDGNWATLIYIPLDNIFLNEFINQCMKTFEDQGLCMMDDLHISLSRTLYLKSHQISNFMNLLEQKLKSQKFQVSFSDLQTYHNDEKTCNFVALNVLCGKSDLLKLVKLVNIVTASFGLPSYYDDPSFHTSFAWSQNNIDLDVKSFSSEAIHNIMVEVSCIHVKCGNKIYEINL